MFALILSLCVGKYVYVWMHILLYLHSYTRGNIALNKELFIRIKFEIHTAKEMLKRTNEESQPMETHW